METVDPTLISHQYISSMFNEKLENRKISIESCEVNWSEVILLSLDFLVDPDLQNFF